MIAMGEGRLETAPAARPDGATGAPCSERGWWQAHSAIAVAAVLLIVSVSAAPFFVGYALAPPGTAFTGTLTYPQDDAQHEAWALEMSANLFYTNVLTPEPTPRGWFVSPVELLLGVAQRVTEIPYPVLRNLLGVICAPVLAFALMTLARRAELRYPGLVAVLALLVGTWAPVAQLLGNLGLPAFARIQTELGADATPLYQLSQGPGLYLLLSALVLVGLSSGNVEELNGAIRWTGVAMFVALAVYPFFGPALGLTTGLYMVLCARRHGWRTTIRPLAWIGACAVLPAAYWLLLPRVDPEFAHFQSINRTPLFSPAAVVLNFGLASGALLGLPRLLRGNRTQQVLGCFTIAVMVALFTPDHPWRSHLYYLSPVLVIAALAAWWPVVGRLRGAWRWLVVAALLPPSLGGDPYYYTRYLSALTSAGPPVFMPYGDQEAIRWLGQQTDDGVVLAPAYVSPWVAARTQHHVLVGHGLWTHDYYRRLDELRRVFDEGADPAPVMRQENIGWILITTQTPAPAWADGIEPAVRFGATRVLQADALLQHVSTKGPYHAE
jgi:hypothetical protein